MQPHAAALKKVKERERQRSNWLMQQERRMIEWCCPRLPHWLSSNMLTGLGAFGSAWLCAALMLGRNERLWLLTGIVGLAINWFGDSLDGRLAYYRKRPRKWFGFVLDLMTDWVSLCLVTAGIAFYLPTFKFIPVAFMAVYGARMLIAALSYKITDAYRIDSGKVGPTEVRLLMSAVLIVETAWPGILPLLGLFATLVLLVVDLVELRNLLALADIRDRLEHGGEQRPTSGLFRRGANAEQSVACTS